MKGKKPLRPTLNNEVEESTNSSSNGKELDKNFKKINDASNISNPFVNKMQKVEKKDEIMKNDNTVYQQEIDNKGKRKDSIKENKDSDHEIEKVIKKKGNEYTFSDTNQSHKRLFKTYKINPKVIPRPNHFDEIYKNTEEMPIFSTNIDNLPPYTNAHYIVNETYNSSPRIVRSSLNKLPPDFNNVTNSNLSFGLYLQPFAEFQMNEKEIPKVDSPEGLFRCKTCEGYLNNKFKIDFGKNNKRVAICNLCGTENELESTNPKVKSEYFNTSSYAPELSCPTVDYIVPNNLKHKVPFLPHYIFAIDVSQISVDFGLPVYILNSLQSCIEMIHNSENSFVAFITYDNRSIRYYYIDKEEVKVSIVSDSNRPFCPIPRKNLFKNCVEQKSEIDKIIEKINQVVKESQNQKVTLHGNISGAAVNACMQALKGNGGRVLLFSANPCLIGFGSSKVRDEKVLEKAETLKNGFIPQHNQFKDLAEEYSDERIAVDLFIIGNTQFDLTTFSQISFLTGGKTHFYTINSKVLNDVSQKLEKMHFDVFRILSRPNYYDVKVMFRHSLGFEVQEIIGQFGRKLGEGIKQPTMDPDFSFSLLLKSNENLKEGTVYHFQFAVLYIDNFDKRYLRIINYSLECISDLSKIYYNVDVDIMTKIMINKELLAYYSNNTDPLKIEENLSTKIINYLFFYRKKCSEKSPMQQLILPASVKFISLFINSLLKKPLVRKNKDCSINSIFCYVLSFMRDPCYWTIKYLYPKFYRIDDIMENQSYKVDDSKLVLKNIGVFNDSLGTTIRPYSLPLSVDYVDFDSAYILDNGEFLNIYIFDQINPLFYTEIFEVDSFYKIDKSEVKQLDENNTNELNVRINNLINQFRLDNRGLNQPIRLYFLTEKEITKDELVSQLAEDSYKGEKFYVDFLAELHQKIQQKLS